VFIPGLSKEGKSVTLGAGDYNFCINTAPVFPAGVLGLDQKGTRPFDIAVLLAKTRPANMLAICPAAITGARLGLADDALARLSMSIRQLQHFPQGLWYNIDHWSSYSKSKKDFVAAQRDYINDHSLKYENIRVGNSENSDERVSTPMQPFIQCGLEPSAILAAAVNEMLLQSYTGVIRVFPATPNDWPAAFTLRAVGGFLVTSEKRPQSGPAYVCITSLLGKECRIVNPWPNENIVVRKDGDEKSVTFNMDNQIIVFPTEKGARYLIQKASDTSPKTPTQFTAQRNTKPKQYFEASLGKSRDF
jgi:alpha-L-fucosidase 2